jgi:hypothetical protein
LQLIPAGTGAGGGPHLTSTAPLTSLRIKTLGGPHGAGGGAETGGGEKRDGPPVAGVLRAGAGVAGGAGMRKGPPVAGMVGAGGITTCGMAPGAGWPFGSYMDLGDMGC